MEMRGLLACIDREHTCARVDVWSGPSECASSDVEQVDSACHHPPSPASLATHACVRARAGTCSALSSVAASGARHVAITVLLSDDKGIEWISKDKPATARMPSPHAMINYIQYDI